MMLADRILKALAGASSQAPVRVDALAMQLGVEPGTLADALFDLTESSAVNKAVITKAGGSHAVVWPTGVPPRAIPWKTKPINGPVFDTRPVPQTHSQETPMPRIARPAASAPIAAEAAPTKAAPTVKPLKGDLTRQILAIVYKVPESKALMAAAVHADLVGATSVKSTTKLIERLAKLGRLGRRVVGTGNRKQTLCWGLVGLPASAQPTTSDPAAPTEPVGRKSKAPSAITASVMAPQPNLDPDAEVTHKSVAHPLNPAPTMTFRAPKTEVRELEPAARGDQSVGWVLNDRAELSLYAGDEMIHLDRAATERLFNFLEATMDVFLSRKGYRA